MVICNFHHHQFTKTDVVCENPAKWVERWVLDQQTITELDQK